MNILNKTLSELKEALGTDFMRGLSKKAVHDNTAAFGINAPFDVGDKIFSAFFKSLLSDVMPWLFLAICILSVFLEKGSSVAASAVLFLIYIVLRLCGFVYVKLIDRRISSYRNISTNVIRSGKRQTINAKNLVPGDIIFLNSGDLIPCDCIIINSDNFSVYETFITNNHKPVAKKSQDMLNPGEPYHSCLIFTGSVVFGGNAKVLVCHTAKNIFNIKNGPLKKLFVNEMPKIHKNNVFVGKQIYLLWILMCFIVFAIGILMKYDVFNMFFIATTLSLAALGDCVPLFSEAAVMTSVSRLYKKYGCVLKNYQAIDTFNSTDTVIIENFNCFLNSMPEINTFYINNSFYSPTDISPQSRDEIIKYAVASMLNQPKSHRYTDIALTKFADSIGIDIKAISNEFIYINNYSGEINAVLTFRNNEYAVISRGFAADMLARCTTVQVNNAVREIGRNERFTLQNHIHNMEMNSQTVIAVVKKTVSFTSENQHCFIDLDRMTLIGFIGFYNPVSTDAVKALSLCKKNNINVVLMEDEPAGAHLDMAKSTSLLEGGDICIDSAGFSKLDEGLFRAEIKKYKIFSQLSQEQRLYITEAYKKNGSILTAIPTTLYDIPLQTAADASVSTRDKKIPAADYYSDALFLNKNFSVFAALVKHSRAIYHNANKMLLYILTNQFFICTLILAGMIFEKTLLFQPAALLLYSVFSVFPLAFAVSCDPPPSDKPLAAPNYNRYMFRFLALIPPPFIIGLTGGIVTVLVHRLYSSVLQTAAAAAIITLFASTFLIALSLRSDDFFFKKKLTPAFLIALIIMLTVLTLIFAIKPLGAIFGLSLPNIEVGFISLIFAFIPFAISEIIKKAKNLTK